jgi:hypothetical protein
VTHRRCDSNCKSLRCTANDDISKPTGVNCQLIDLSSPNHSAPFRPRPGQVPGFRRDVTVL